MKSFRNKACSWRSLSWRRNWGREAAALPSVRLLNKGRALELLTYNANELNKYCYDPLPLCSGCFLTFFFLSWVALPYLWADACVLLWMIHGCLQQKSPSVLSLGRRLLGDRGWDGFVPLICSQPFIVVWLLDRVHPDQPSEKLLFQTK